jgi:hypothetical protein
MHDDGELSGELASLPERYHEPFLLNTEIIAGLWPNIFVSGIKSRLRLGAIVSKTNSYPQDHPELENATPEGYVAVHNQGYEARSLEDRKRPVSEERFSIESIDSEQSLRAYLGSAVKQHILFVRKLNSSMPLGISADLFRVICAETNAPEALPDFLMFMGKRGTNFRLNDSEVELAFPPTILEATGQTRDKAARFSIVCGLRYIDRNSNDLAETQLGKWSLRQSVISFVCMPASRSSTWVLFSAPESVESQMLQAMRTDRADPFVVLCNMYETVGRLWRFYIADCAAEISNSQNEVLLALPDESGPIASLTTPQDRQQLLLLEERLLNAKLAIQSTLGDVKTCRIFCLDNDPVLRDLQLIEQDTTVRKLQQLERDLEIHLLRLENLHSRLQGLTTIVSNFLELRNGYVLQSLAKETRRENVEMRLLNKEMRDMARTNAKDSAQITVLTILTLLYLPLTVVSNFFSTSFVGTTAAGSSIFVTDDVWLLFATTIPLTAFTVCIWWVWSDYKANGEYPHWWPRRHRRQQRGTVP